MAEKEKSLEMRVAELEDKLSKLHITEEEWKAYHKVATALGGAGGGVGGVCVVRSCIVRACVTTCSIACIVSCINECSCGPCIQSGGGGGAGGGFGGLGT